MSGSREKFIDALKSRGMWHEGAEWVIDANLNAHAHELAEKIRAAADDEQDYYQPQGMYAAADLIDPEVK